jgi:hypothetical protein
MEADELQPLRRLIVNRPPVAPPFAVALGEHLFVDSIYESLRRYGAKEGILAAWCITADGRKLLLHLAVGNKESEACWTEFLRDMVGRGHEAGLRHAHSLLRSLESGCDQRPRAATGQAPACRARHRSPTTEDHEPQAAPQGEESGERNGSASSRPSSWTFSSTFIAPTLPSLIWVSLSCGVGPGGFDSS